MENKFEKFLFGTFLNDFGVAKYHDEKGRITLKVENVVRGVTKGFPVFFDTEDEYGAWIDNIVDDETATYNKAESVNRVINAIFND